MNVCTCIYIYIYIHHTYNHVWLITGFMPFLLDMKKNLPYPATLDHDSFVDSLNSKVFFKINCLTKPEEFILSYYIIISRMGKKEMDLCLFQEHKCNMKYKEPYPEFEFDLGISFSLVIIIYHLHL